MKRRLLALALVFCIWFSCIYPIGVTATEEYHAEIMYAKGGAESIISMSFDDGYYATATWLNQQFAQRGLKGSLVFITERIEDDSVPGTLEEWQALIAQGKLEALNHSASHLYFAPDDGSYPQYEKNNTAENYQTEIVDSNDALETYFGEKSLVFCPAGGIMSGDGFAVMRENYYSARLTGSIGNVLKGHDVSMQSLDPKVGTELGDWYNLKTLSVHLSGDEDRAQLLCDYVDTAIAQKGWFLPYCHGVVETGDKEGANNMTPEEAEIFFDYIAEKQAAGQVWCAGIGEATKYIRQRQASTVTETGNDNSRTVTLTMAEQTEDGLPLDAEVFNLPLTVKAEVPLNWETVTYTQNGKTATATAFTDRAKRYVYVDLIPNGGAATLTMASERQTINDHQPLDPSLVPYWQAEYTFLGSDYDYAALDKYGVFTEDEYAKIPVLIDTYYSQDAIDQNHPNQKPPVIMYVINTQTERIGTDSDAEIVQDMIDEGYIVLVCDYQNDARALSPDLDWGLQTIRCRVLEGKYLNGHTYTDLEEMYILPAGYRLSRNVKYFNYEENGTTGVIQQIIDVWNDDINGDGTHTAFKKKFGKTEVTLSDGSTTTVNDIVADSIDDCVKPDGTPIDLNLYMDIMYPSNPENEVPVMILSSSSEERMGGWTYQIRPHMTGFLFAGYAGAVYDHAYTPMSRTDHYGYFDGTPTSAFTLMPYTGVKSTTAVSRRIRYLADAEPEKYKFDTEHVGVYGHSKGASSTLLAAPDPESGIEQYYFDGYTAEDAAYDATRQPWTTYPSSGEKIPSQVQMAYYSSGSGVEYFSKEGQAPTFTSAGQNDSPYVGVYPQAVNTLREYDIPSMHFSMPKVGHTIIYGRSEKYDVDMYTAFFDFAHYWLKDAPATAEYILPKDGTREVDARDEISIKFSGPVSQEEITKVRVTNDARGEEIRGSWRSEFGNTLWIFTPTGMYGGENHTVTVPQTILAQNGKALREEKRVSFQTKYETAVAATTVDSDANMTLTKSSDAEDGVYLVFDGADCAESVRTTLRFTVTNDAAQHLQVYALEEINQEDIKQSAIGDWVAEVKLAGKGTYEADVTEYVKANTDKKTLGFVLKAEKEVGETVIVDTDFDNRKDQGFTASAKQYVLDGNACYKQTSSSSSFRLAFFGYDDVTEEDFGRRFRASVDVYTEKDRTLSVYVGTYQPNVDLSDVNGNTQKYLKAKANTWNNFQLEYVVNDPLYYTENANKRTLNIEREGTTYNHLVNTMENLYFDNFKITEIVTEAVIASEASETGFAPALVLRNSDITKADVSNLAYVKDGADADSSFNGGLVSGGEGGMSTGTYQKVYAKVNMADFDSTAEQSLVSLNVTNGASGTMYVYGMESDAADLDLSTISYLNAPANNRFGGGVNGGLVYGGEPIATLAITGNGEYRVDVTDYLQAMKGAGAEAAGLIFVSADSQTPIEFELQTQTQKQESPALYSKTFTYDNFTELRYSSSATSEVNTQYDFTGNAPTLTSIDDTVNHGSGSGKSIKVAPTSNSSNIKFYNLFDHELTEADLGRTFDVDVYVKVDPGTITSSCAFYLGLMSWNGDSTYNNTQYGSEGTDSNMQLKCIVAAANTDWVKYTYSIRIEEFMLAESNRAYNPTLFGIKFYTRCANRTFWIDDLTITETTPSAVPAVDILGAEGVVISNQAVAADAPLAVSASGDTGSIYKTYLNFGAADYENIQLATLNLQVKNAQPHNLSVYAIPDLSYPGAITFNNAPANQPGTGMDTSKVYGMGPLAAVAMNGSGLYTVDVTEYIKNNPGGDSVFAIATGDAVGKEYLKLDFETFPFSKDVDYESYGGFSGSVTTDGGACTVSGVGAAGEGIRILNAFGNGTVCDPGVSYKLTADITPVGEEEGYTLTAGVAADGAAPSQSRDFELNTGEATTVTFAFIANSEEGVDFSNLVFMDSSSVPMEGFVIDNLVLCSELTEIREAYLEIGTAKEPDLPDYRVEDYVFTADGSTVSAFDRTVDTVKVSVYNEKVTGFAPRLLVALYDGDALKSVSISQQSTVEPKTTVELVCSGIDLSDTAIDCVKLMLWDGLDSMTPLMGETTITLN